MHLLHLRVAAAIAALFTVTQPLSTDISESDLSERKNVVLFTIKAHSGRVAVDEYLNTNTDDGPFLPDITGLPDLYRSVLLNNLSSTIRVLGLKYIVAEMRKAGKMVAQVKFDVTRDVNKVNMHSWFSVDRLVSSYPYWIGPDPKKFLYFSITGRKKLDRSRGAWRTFYIMNFEGGCKLEVGFMGISELGGVNAPIDWCDWMSDNRKLDKPFLFYSTQNGQSIAQSVAFADNFIIYGTAEES